MLLSRLFPTLLRVRPNVFWLQTCWLQPCWFLGLLLPLLISGPAQAVTITDDFGTVITLNKPAKRIICLYGAMNEILSVMGLTDRIIARTKGDTFSQEMAAKPSIGTHMRPNVEMVVGLRPDVVLQMAGRKAVSESLHSIRQHGIPTALFKVATMKDLYALITRIGIITGEKGRADNLILSMQQRIAQVQTRLGPHPRRPGVFFEVRYPNLLAAGQGSIVSEIITLAGGKNCVRLNKKLVRLSEEEVVSMNPEVYLLQQGPMNPNPVNPKERPHFRTIEAVKTGRILMVDEHLFSRPGPETVTAIELLADYLHPKDEVVPVQ